MVDIFTYLLIYFININILKGYKTSFYYGDVSKNKSLSKI